LVAKLLLLLLLRVLPEDIDVFEVEVELADVTDDFFDVGVGGGL
jgi:hypothetical protein